MSKLFCDLKSDEEKYNFFLFGHGYETGVISITIQNDVALAYKRCCEFSKVLTAERKRREEAEAELARLREALEAVEYRGEDDDCCPICMAMRKEGHSNECIIGAAIATQGRGDAS